VNVEKIREESRREGTTTRKLEELTSSMPSSTWLIAAGASIVGSLVLKIMGRSQTAIFVGEWAPTFLILGLYNKLVKVAGSQRAGSERTAMA
jgi:hypothetical protein